MIYTTPIKSENHRITGKNSPNSKTKEYDLIHIVSVLSVEQLTVCSFVLSQPFLVFVEFFLLGLQKKRKNREGWCM